MSRRPAWLLVVFALLSILALSSQRGHIASQPAVTPDWTEAAARMPRDLAPVALAAIQADAGPEYAARLVGDTSKPAPRAAAVAFDVSFGAGGALLASRGTSGIEWRLPLRLAAAGYGDTLTPVGAAELSLSGNRAEYRRAGLTEWYVNGPLGLEQGFTLDEALAGRLPGRPLALALDLGGEFRAEAAAGSLTFTGPRGARLRYGHLYVTDATGRSLNAWLESAGGQARILVDDSDAVYPIVIDPIVEKQRLNAADESSGTTNGFGISVSVSSGTAVIGAYLVSGAQSEAGAAYVFVRQGGNWLQQAKLVAPDPADFDSFGANVAISGNVIVVGAPARNSLTGGVYVFLRTGTTWNYSQTLTPPTDPSDPWTPPSGNVYFGSSVAVDQGNLIVGAAMENNLIGAAYAYGNASGIFLLRDKLEQPSGALEGQFGAAAAINGTTAVIGAPDANDTIGAAYVFTRSGAVWSQQQVLIPSEGDSGDAFGESVAVSGDTALIGAPGCGCLEGGAYAFVRSGGSWSEQQKLTISTAVGLDFWGESVALTGDTAVLGGIGVNDFTGAAAVFTRSGSTWSQTTTLSALDGFEDAVFGFAVAIDSVSLEIMIGAPADCTCSPTPGAAYLFVNAPDTAEITSPVPGTMLFNGTETFTWTAPTGAQAYYLIVGTTPGGGEEIYSAAQGTNTSVNVPFGYFFSGLPVGPDTRIYVRMFTNFGGSDWRKIDYTYITSPTFVGVTLDVPARITSPAQGSTFTSSTPTFTWSSSPGALDYFLTVGTSNGGGMEIYKANQGLSTSVAVPMTFRSNGQPVPPNTPVYVRLKSNYGGSDWVQIDYSFVTMAGGGLIGAVTAPAGPAVKEPPLPAGVTPPVDDAGNQRAARDAASSGRGLPPGVPLPPGVTRAPGLAPIPTGVAIKVPPRVQHHPPRPAVTRTPNRLIRRPGATVPTPRPTPTPAPRPSASPTPAPSPTQKPAPTAMPSATPVPRPTASPLPSATPSPIPSPSPTASASPGPSAAPGGQTMAVQGTLVQSGGRPASGATVQAVIGTTVCGEGTSDATGQLQVTVLAAVQRSGCGAPGTKVTLRLASGAVLRTVTFTPGVVQQLGVVAVP